MPVQDLKEDVVESLFQALLLKDLLKRKRISPALVESMASWKFSGFSVSSQPAPASPSDPHFYIILRYMKKPSFALKRICLGKEEEKVIYRAEFNPILGTDRIETDPMDFLAKVLMHVPEKNKRRLTYSGIYSSQARGERKKKIQALGEDAQESHPLFNEPCTDPDAFAKKPRQAWAALIKNVWEIDPLGCPRCGAQMKVVAFITDPCVIDKILKHLDKKNRGPREEGAAA